MYHVSFMDFHIFLFSVLLMNEIIEIEALLCYNGTFTNKDVGQDPIFGSVFTSRRRITKIQCSLTVRCPG